MHKKMIIKPSAAAAFPENWQQQALQSGTRSYSANICKYAIFQQQLTFPKESTGKNRGELERKVPGSQHAPAQWLLGTEG